jgi:branched-subunit amino acid aminotransferase/4-amino-4-deoxychorismate lyase
LGQLTQSRGVDVADWIKDYNLTAEDIMKAVIQDAEAFRAKLEKQFPKVLEGSEATVVAQKAQLTPIVTADALCGLYRDQLA